MNLLRKKNEIFKLVLIGIFIGIIVSEISNIIFAELYEGNEKIFFLITMFFLIVLILIIINYIIRTETSSIKSVFLMAYDLENKKFIDIPFSATSVNARLLYNSLAPKLKEKIKITNIFDMHEKSNDFINGLIVQLILSRILVNPIFTHKVNINKLKDILIIFRYIDIDSIIKNQEDEDKILKEIPLTLPRGFSIKNVTNNTIRIDSRFGFINFKWDLLSCGKNGDYIKYLTSFSEIKSENCIQYLYNVEFEYGFKLMSFLTNTNKEFNGFIELCSNEMINFDISKSIERFDLSKFSMLLNKIEK